MKSIESDTGSVRIVDRAFERDIFVRYSTKHGRRNLSLGDRERRSDAVSSIRDETEEGGFSLFFFFFLQQRSSFAEKLPRSKPDDKSS